MGTLQFKNNASTTLSGLINNTQTAVTVTSSAAFPVPSAGDYFYATMYEVSGSTEINIEIVKVTAVSGNNWTIVRAQDGTTARARDGVSTCYIEQRMTAAAAQLMVQRDNNLSDLASAATARTNLGLGSMATQDASSVAITGGTISGVAITGIDSTTTIADNADSTKKVAFEVSGVTTGTTRTLTVPNESGTIALTSNLTSGYQPLNSNLTAIAGLSANGLIARSGSGTVAVRIMTAPAAGLTVSNGDGVSGNPTLALANDLAAVESISTTGFVRRTGVDTWSASAIVDGDLPAALTGKTYNALTLTANATGFSVAGGTSSKTLTVNNSVTLAGTDGTTITLPATSGTVALNNQAMFIGTTSVAINRSSGALSLTGVNIDGSAGSATTATTATRASNLAGGNGTTLFGAIGYQSGTDTTTLLSPNTTATKQFLSMTGTGTNGAAPAWSAVSKSDVGLSNVENTALSTWAGSSNVTTLGTVGAGTWNATTISIAKGGTGATTAVAAFDALSPATTLGDMIYSNGTDNVRLAGNTSTTRRFLRQTGTGTVSAAPAWDTLTDPDIPSALTGKTYNGLTLTAAGTGFTVAGGATSKTLTVSNTLTLAGTDGSTLNVGAGGTLGSAAYTASTAYAPAAGSASITTVGTISSGTWTGSAVGISYGGTGASSKTAAFDALSPLTTLGDLIYRDGTNNVRLAGNTTSSKRFLTQTGTGTVSAAPGWNAIVDGDLPSALTGKTYNGLTLTANATGFAVAGGTTAKTLTISNNLTLAGTDGSTLNIGAGGTLGSAAFTASTAYAPAAGSASITTLGTIATGVWNGTTIGVAYGGTGVTTSTGTGNNVLSNSPTFTGTVTVASIAPSGNLAFSGNGNRITADFSNATASLRAAFQTSTTNNNTVVPAIPNGTATAAYYIAHNASTVDNSSYFYLGATAGEAVLRADRTGTANYLPITFYTNAAERMRLDTSGNLGIGTNAPGYPLHLVRTLAGNIVYGVAVNTDTTSGSGAGWAAVHSGVSTVLNSRFDLGLGQVGTFSNHPVAFYVNTIERMRLDTAGNLGVGTSSADGYASRFLQLYGATDSSIRLTNSTTGTTKNNGSDIQVAGLDLQIINRESAAIRFYTGITERVAIDASGNLLVGTQSTLSSGSHSFICAAGGSAPLTLRHASSAAGRYWFNGPDNAGNFIVYNNSSVGAYLSYGATAWTASSDERVKDIIEPIENAAEKVSSLRAVIGKYKKDAEGIRRSFLIAQDVQAVLPEAVDMQDDEMGTLGVRYTDTIPLLVAAIQEQQQLIAALQARLDAAGL